MHNTFWVFLIPHAVFTITCHLNEKSLLDIWYDFVFCFQVLFVTMPLLKCQMYYTEHPSMYILLKRTYIQYMNQPTYTIEPFQIETKQAPRSPPRQISIAGYWKRRQEIF